MASGSYSRFRQLLNYLRPHWKQTALGVVALLVVNVLAVFIPRIIGQAVDELQRSSDFDLSQISRYSLMVLGLASLMWVIRLTSRQLIFGVGRKVEFDLKQRIFEHLLGLEPSYFSNHAPGDLINRATSDVDKIRRLVGFAVLSLINTLLAYTLVIPAMMVINVRLSLLALSVYPVMLLMVQISSTQLRGQQEAVQEELSDLSELIQEDMSGIGLIKIYAQEANERLAFAVINRRLLKANLSLAKTRNFLFPLLEGLASLSLLFILWLGSREIARQVLSVGDFVTLIIYVQQLVFPTALLGFTISAYQQGEVSVDRVEAILRVDASIQTVAQPQPLPQPLAGWLKADGLSYTYPGAASPALDNVSFSIQPHQTVAVVGPIGAGKSTLANAIPRLLDIAPGQLFIDGLDLTQLDLAALRGAIAYVPKPAFCSAAPSATTFATASPSRSNPGSKAPPSRPRSIRKSSTFPANTTPWWGSGASPCPGASASAPPWLGRCWWMRRF